MNDLRKKDDRRPQTLRMDAAYGASFARITDVLEHGATDRKKEEMDKLLTMMTLKPASPMFQSARRILHSLQSNDMVPPEYRDRVRDLTEKYPYRPSGRASLSKAPWRRIIESIRARSRKK